MEDGLARPEAEPGGDVARCGDALRRDEGTAIVVAALPHFAGDAGDVQQGRLRLVLGHEAADARHPHDPALLHEGFVLFWQRLVIRRTTLDASLRRTNGATA